MVVCQPGITAVAKSMLTIVCTENTSGVAKPSQVASKPSHNDATSVQIRPNRGRAGTRNAFAPSSPDSDHGWSPRSGKQPHVPEYG